MMEADHDVYAKRDKNCLVIAPLYVYILFAGNNLEMLDETKSGCPPLLK